MGGHGVAGTRRPSGVRLSRRVVTPSMTYRSTHIRSKAWTESSWFEYRPGVYARDFVPCCWSSQTCQSWRFVRSQKSTASEGSKSDAAAIRGLAATMKKAGYPIKVAIVATPNDLGLVPQIFGKPQYYAGYLGREIDFNKKNQLLVVMPAGYGTNNVPPKVAAALNGLKPPGSKVGDIASSTVDAMARLSKAAGHPVVGDRVYGPNRKLAAALGLDRPFLHAARLSFEHPSTGASIELEDPLPPDLVAALEAARTRS